MSERAGLGVTPDLFESLSESGAPPVPPPAGASRDETGDGLPLADYAERAYLEYAMSVVKGRALPDYADGQKPVQRRILYAMHEMRLGAEAKPVKSARVVGEILGKYHPHGDASAYDAMVRLAQEFTMRYPLIDGHGNFGSRDGDGAAAMRYTEARLTRLAELLLAEIDLGTVDFAPNYDGAFQEPAVLPSRLPMVLLNGASGIAVGMATEIPSHNLREVAEAAIAVLRQPALTTEQLLAHMPGPDFPGGGQVITPPKDIQGAYETGRGSVRVRARWSVEELARREWRIVVHELPHGVSAQKVLTEIEEATNPKIKAGKKALTAEQVQLKQLMLSALDKARDEADQHQPVRLVLEPKMCRQPPDDFMNLLLAHTSLETSVPINLVMVGRDGRPTQKSLAEILREWVSFRLDTVRRRAAFRWDQVRRRIHILEGRMLVLLRLDEVIQVIRESDDPKQDLIARFSLTEAQAEDILEIRLRQLARLEAIKVEKELAQLRAEEQELSALLANPEALRRLVAAEIRNDAKRYGDDRRTLILPTERASAGAYVSDEPVTVILSRNGWIRSRAGHGLDIGSLSFKDGDALLGHSEIRSIHPVVLLDSRGRAYTLSAADVPGGRGDGVPVSSLVDLQEGAGIVQMIAGDPADRYLVAGSGGYGFIAAIRDMISRVRAGKAFMALDAGERVLAPARLSCTDNPHLAVLSGDGRLLVAPLEEVKEMAKGRGVVLMKLDKEEFLLDVAMTDLTALAVEGTGRGGRPECLDLRPRMADYVGHRGRRGRPLPKPIKPRGFARTPRAKPDEPH